LLLATVATSIGTMKPTGCPWISRDQEDWGGSQCVDLSWVL